MERGNGGARDELTASPETPVAQVIRLRSRSDSARYIMYFIMGEGTLSAYDRFLIQDG